MQFRFPIIIINDENHRAENSSSLAQVYHPLKNHSCKQLVTAQNFSSGTTL